MKKYLLIIFLILLFLSILLGYFANFEWGLEFDPQTFMNNWVPSLYGCFIAIAAIIAAIMIYIRHTYDDCVKELEVSKEKWILEVGKISGQNIDLQNSNTIFVYQSVVNRLEKYFSKDLK